MDDYSTIEFVEARNAPNNRVVVQRGPGGGQMISAGPGQRTFYPHPGYGQSPSFYAQPGFGVGIGSGAMFGRLTTGQVIDMVAQIFAPRGTERDERRRHRLG
jgi:hypothetical protein